MYTYYLSEMKINSKIFDEVISTTRMTKSRIYSNIFKMLNHFGKGLWHQFIKGEG